jgi:flagellin
MKELAEQASTESYSDQQRGIMNQEFQELAEEISRIAENTEFNGISLLNEDQTHNIHLGSKDGEGVVGVRGANMTAAGLDLQGTASTIILGEGVADPNDTSYLVATDPGNEGMGVRFAEDGDLWAVFYGPGGRSMNGVATAFNVYASAPYPVGGGRLPDEDPWHVDDSTYEPAEVVYNEDSGLYELHVTAYTNGEDNEITGIWNETAADITWANSTVTQGDGVDTDASIDTVEQAVEAAHRVEDAIVTAQDQRARMGYTINRLEASSKVLGIQAENALASQSRISDVDVAREMAAMTRNQVVAQAGLSMLSQANSIPQIALQLLQSQSN